MRAIALSGMMAAGKSTVSNTLRDEHGFTVLAFGDLVRAEASLRRIDRSDRGALQALGQNLFHELGADGLVDRLLTGTEGDLVIDGVRHLAILEQLRRRLPSLVFAFLQADGAELDRRWQLRGDTAARGDAASHSVEGELAQLRDRAEIVFNAGTVSASTIAKMLAIGAVTR